MANKGDHDKAYVPDLTVDGTANADLALQDVRELLKEHNDDLTLPIGGPPYSRRTWVEVAERLKRAGYAVKMYDDEIVIRRL